MDNIFHDWIRDFIDTKFIDTKFFINKDRITVNKIARIFSQQLCNLKIDEEKFEKMVKK